MIVEAIPGHSQVIADIVFTGALPGLDAESTFLKDVVEFNLENFTFTAGICYHPSVINVGVLQDCLEDDGLEMELNFLVALCIKSV